MRTKKQYIEGLRKMRHNIYFDGAKINRADEVQMDCINTLGATFDEAAKPENADLLTATSHLTGHTINRFTHVHQNKEDLHKKQDMTRFMCRTVGGCTQRCMGVDATNAIYTVSYEADKMNNGRNPVSRKFQEVAGPLSGRRPGRLLRPDGRQGRSSAQARRTARPGRLPAHRGKEE